MNEATTADTSLNEEVIQTDSRMTFTRFTLVYAIAGLIASAVLVFPEASDHPTRFRVIYSIWGATALLIPTVAFFLFANVSSRARVYWVLFYSSAYALYLIHFYFATFVFFGGFRGTIEGQGPWIAWGNFILTLLWTLDVVVMWTATSRDYRAWNRHLLTLLIIVGAFLFFTVVRNDGFVRWIGVALASALVVGVFYRVRYGRRIRNTSQTDSARPMETYFRGSLEAESRYFERFVQQINRVQRRIRDANYPSPYRRAFHAKQHLGVSNASFEVTDDIPNDLRISLFRESATHTATVRFSNASGVIQADSVRDLRGIALRVHLDNEHAHDFLATNAPASHARDAYQFMAVAIAASKPFRFLLPLRLLFSVGPIETVRILWVVLRSRSQVSDLSTETYWSRSAIRVGDTAVRYLLKPRNRSLASLGQSSPNYLRAQLVKQLQHDDVVFDLYFQRFVDEKRTPIEDSAVEWTEAVSPPIKVGRLTIPQQSLNSPTSDRMEAHVSSLDFNPWRTTDDLRPLGSQNRARQMVYQSSADLRRKRKQVEIGSRLISLPVQLMIPVFRAVNLVIPWHRLPFPFLEILNLDTFRHLLRERNLHHPQASRHLVTSTSVEAFDSSRTSSRQSDGTYNDLTDTQMGRAGSVFGRNVAIDQLTEPTRQSVLEPNPRRISRELHARETFVPATTLNIAAAAWIQFQVHGWFNHTKLNRVFRARDHWEVRLAPDDPWNEYENGTMRIPKTPRSGITGNNIPTFVNTESHWWDASQIYGNSPEETDRLREKESGYMRMDGELLPVDPSIPDRFGKFDLTGFSDNYWLGLSLMHTLFVREHNAICDRLLDEFPARKHDDDWLFHKARLINAALMAKIHTVEWTPGILGRHSLHTSMRANWWGVLGEQFKETFGRISEAEEVSGIIGSAANHHTAPYSLTEDFVTVYRMHPLIPDQYSLIGLDNSQHRVASFAEINAGATRQVMTDVPQADLWYSLGTAHPGAISLKNFPNQLRDLVVNDGRHIDLATIDNIRDRERAIPRYNSFRRHLRMKPIKRWKDITADPALAEAIRDVYRGDLEQVDTMVGLHAETPPEGFGFSDTAFRIFILMASRRLKSDRFYTNDYNVETYTRPGLDWIRDNLMTDVLLRHFPTLEPAIKGVGNAFAPWNTL